MCIIKLSSLGLNKTREHINLRFLLVCHFLWRCVKGKMHFGMHPFAFSRQLDSKEALFERVYTFLLYNVAKLVALRWLSLLFHLPRYLNVRNIHAALAVFSLLSEKANYQTLLPTNLLKDHYMRMVFENYANFYFLILILMLSVHIYIRFVYQS